MSLNSYYVLQLREVGLIYFPNVYYPKISKQFTVVLCILFMSHANKDSPIGTVAPQIKTSISITGSTKLDLQLWISLSFRSHLHDSHVVL